MRKSFFSKKSQSKVFLVFIALSLTASCSSRSLDSLGSLMDSDAQVELNLLTGLPGENVKILGVKIDDSSPAHPQIGLESADVIYIEQVEGGMTRLLALYSSIYPIKIGPIRSARISDIDILAEYGRVGFIFSGAQQRMYPIIAAANLANIGAQRNSPSIYFRDAFRRAPVDMFVSPSKLLEADKNAESIDQVKSPGWIFGDNPGVGREVEKVVIRWPAARYSLIWSEIEDRWLINFNGSANLTESGYQLGSPTFLIQMVDIVASSFGDKFGGVTPRTVVIGDGRGYLLRDGQVIEVLWSRPSAESVTTWSLQDGSPAPFDPGQIWIALTDQVPEFSFPPPLEATSLPSGK